MKYIGPFLRINSLTLENLESQLFFFSKEAFNQLVLKSRCGVTLHPKNVKKLIPNIDINIIKDFSPLICIYKKANPKIIREKDYAYFDSGSFKKEVVPNSNSFMTLAMLELVEYYEFFKDIAPELYTLSTLYRGMARQQLDFYTTYLRNGEGVFVTKKNVSDDTSDKLVFEDKDSKFKFSDQALMMVAFYKYSMMDDSKDSDAYREFSLDILRMLMHYKDSLYELSFEELNKTVYALNILYYYGRNNEVGALILDILELLTGRFDENPELRTKLNHSSLFLLNLSLSSNVCSLDKLQEKTNEIRGYLSSLYSKELCMIIANKDKKEVKFYSEDLLLFLLSMLSLNEDQLDGEEIEMLKNVYRHQVVNSGLISHWPELPTLDSPERYQGFSLSSKDLMEDNCFKLDTLNSPKGDIYAPIFLKSVEYNIKKEAFSQGKVSFDSNKNMPLLFSIIFLLKNKIYKLYNLK